MSSATSTDGIRLTPDATDPPDRTDQSLQPWQFFVLAALSCATAATWVVRGHGVTAVILLTILMGATALVGLAVLRTVRPLLSSHLDRTPMIGGRTRAALEREKLLSLRAIKELEFDRAMGKLSEADFREMATPLRARASRLIRQLDASSGYRDRIESDLAKRMADKSPKDADAAAARTCQACAAVNDADARFCKGCGVRL